MVVEKAYAKINLYLDVLSKRSDGFHDIVSVMSRVSLADTVKVCASESEKTNIKITVYGADLPCDNKNIAYKAAERYLEKAKIAADIDICIEKIIPIGAGLAGGSADAAATLRALNRIYSALSEEELITIASELGSDVPFCLVGGTALCEGRGEKISKLHHKERHLVISIGNESVNTAEAYRELDRIFNDFSEERKPLFNPFEEVKLFNIFEVTAKESTLTLKEKLLSLSATGTLMSGSGPSVFGIFENKRDAEIATESLRNDGYRAYYAVSIE